MSISKKRRYADGLRGMRQGAYWDALRAEDEETREDALARAEAATLAHLGMLPIVKVTDSARARVEGARHDLYAALDNRYGAAVDAEQGQQVDERHDPAFWADMTLTSDPQSLPPRLTPEAE